MIDNCIFSYISAGVFAIGILIYSYFLYLDSTVKEGSRTKDETVWVWGLYLLLFMGFFISIFCANHNAKDDLSYEFSKMSEKFGNTMEQRSDRDYLMGRNFGHKKRNRIKGFFGEPVVEKFKRIKKNTPVHVI